MRPELSRRIGAAVGTHVITPEERATIVAATEDPAVEVWDDLSDSVQQMVIEIASRPGLTAEVTS